MPDFHVGRYAAYIGPAYAISVAVIGWMVAATLIGARKWKKAAQKNKDKQA